MEKPIFTTTAHTIGKITYYIVSEPSEKARENLDKKLEKLIRKDLCAPQENPCLGNETK